MHVIIYEWMNYFIVVMRFEFAALVIDVIERVASGSGHEDLAKDGCSRWACESEIKCLLYARACIRLYKLNTTYCII